MAEKNNHDDVVAYLLSQDAECPDGKVESETGDSCITPPTCGENEMANGDSCVCVSGYERVNDICVLECAANEKRINDVCVPTIASCNEMDKIRNANLECESCGANEEPQNNSCQCIDGTTKQVGSLCLPDAAIKCAASDGQWDIGENICECPQDNILRENGRCESCDSGHLPNSDKTECHPTPEHCRNLNPAHLHEGTHCTPPVDGEEQLHPTDNRFVPTIAHCNEMDKIRNANFECESCGTNEEPQNNSCQCIDGTTKQVGSLCLPDAAIKCAASGGQWDIGENVCECPQDNILQENGRCESCDSGHLPNSDKTECHPTPEHCRNLNPAHLHEGTHCTPPVDGEEQLHPTDNRFVPTIAHCNEMDKIRNANFECESCNEEFIRDGNSCVCGENEELQGDSCVCETGFTKYDGVNCVAECIDTYRWQKGMCVPRVSFCREMGQRRNPDTLQCEDCPNGQEVRVRNTCVAKCGNNEIADGNSCVCVDDHTKYDGVNCVANCLDTEKWDGACVPILVCPDNADLSADGNSCECPAGHEWDAVNNICIDNRPRTCSEEGKHWLPENQLCVNVPPFLEMRDNPISVLEEYHSTGGDLDAVGYYVYPNEQGINFRLIDFMTSEINLSGGLNKFRYLVDNGASVDHWTIYSDLNSRKVFQRFALGNQPWYSNDRQNRTSALQYMLDNRNVDLDVRYPRDGHSSSLHSMAYWGGERNEHFAPILLSAGANVNVRSDYRNTPLIRSVYRKNRGMTDVLLDYNANCNINNNGGWSAYDYARNSDEPGILQHLKNRCIHLETQSARARASECQTELLVNIEEDGSTTVTEVVSEDCNDDLDMHEFMEQEIPPAPIVLEE